MIQSPCARNRSTVFYPGLLFSSPRLYLCFLDVPLEAFKPPQSPPPSFLTNFVKANPEIHFCAYAIVGRWSSPILSTLHPTLNEPPHLTLTVHSAPLSDHPSSSDYYYYYYYAAFLSHHLSHKSGNSKAHTHINKNFKKC